MKINVLLILTTAISGLFYISPVHAQCNVSPVSTISGDTCTSSVLIATSNFPASVITWKLNGATVSTQTAQLQSSGITIAGGNGNGAANNQLSNPDRIYVDQTGNLYIPDLSNNRVQKWAPGATSGTTVAGGNGSGSSPNQFNRPSSVWVDSQGNIYVTDQNNGRVQKWAPGATSGTTVAGGSLGYLSYPTAVCLDLQGNMYVSDQLSSLVKKWTPGSTSGIVVAGGNGYGSAANQLSAPTGIAVDSAGNIYICDTDNNRVQKWAPGATTGTTVAGGNGFGNGANQLANPLAIHIDCSGALYIGDFNNHRVQKWVPGATSGVTVAGGNGIGTNANQLYGPIGIAQDANNNLIVAEFYNHRVQKFATTIINSYTATTAGYYTATVSSTCCSSTSNTIKIVPSKTLQISISSNTTVACPNIPVVFTATMSGSQLPSFQWKKNGINVGGNSNTYTENTPSNGDEISCTLSSNESCLTSPTAKSNSIFITVKRVPVDVNIGSDLTLCAGETVVLNARSHYAIYKWQDATPDSLYTVSKPGTYFVQVQDSCGKISFDTVLVSSKDCRPKGFFIPNAFSPNNNGYNETFKPLLNGVIKKYQFKIFNRYGQMVFNSNEPGVGWDGTIRGLKQEQSVFAWVCIFQLDGEPIRTEKGTVLLIR